MSHRNATSRPGGRRDDAAARRVLALLDGQEILRPGPEFVAQSSRQGERKFHIGNLSYDATEPDLRELFKSLGTIIELHLFRDSYDGKSRGFAVLRMADGDAFVLQGQLFMGRELRIDNWDRE
jgi:hypothetical protein